MNDGWYLGHVKKGRGIRSIFGLGFSDEGGEHKHCIYSAPVFPESKLVGPNQAMGFSDVSHAGAHPYS